VGKTNKQFWIYSSAACEIYIDVVQLETGAVQTPFALDTRTACTMTIPTATIGLVAGQDLSAVVVVNTPWDGTDAGTHYLMNFASAAYPGSYLQLSSSAGTLYWQSGAQFASKAINASNWAANTNHIIVVTRQGANMQVYLDGVAGTATTTATPELTLDANLSIGTDNAGANFVNGAILCAIWNRVLSAAEIATLSAGTDWDTMGYLPIGTVSFTAATRGATAWDREVIYGYQAGTLAKYYIPASDWPTGTKKVRVSVSLNANGTIYVDKLWFGSVEYVSDYAADGVIGLNIDDIKGDVPALADFYLGNPYTSPPWKSQESGTTNWLYGVSAVDATHVWAVGQGGKILFYNGANWSAQTSGTTNILFGVFAVDATHVWAVGFNGTILFYNGANWAPEASGTTNWLFGVSAVDVNHVYAVGTTGTILFKHNGGAWATEVSGTTKQLNGVSACDDTHIIAVGDDGTILTSANGVNWTDHSLSPWIDENLYGVYILDATHAWAVGESGVILFSGDAGATWGLRSISVYPLLRSVYAFDTSHIWIVGFDGTIVFYNGTTWTLQSSGTGENLHGVDALSATSVWAVGETGTILHGIYSAGALAITDLILGQKNGNYSSLYNPVKETPALDTLGGAVTIAWSPYRRWSSYRTLAAGKIVDFLFNLAAHYGSRYMITAGISFGAATAFDKGTIHLLLQTTAGTAITTQYISDEVDLSDPNTKFREVALQTDDWDVRNVPSHVVSDDAVLGNINQVVELIAHASLATTLYIDYIAIIPVDHWTRVKSIASNYLIIDSTLGYVMDSLDGGPSTAMAHAPTNVVGVPDFMADPEGMNMTLVAIEDVSNDQRVGMVNIEMQYIPLYLLVSEG
jgi:photosystem II stability/assembly factor-like uncharacterized protein